MHYFITLEVNKLKYLIAAFRSRNQVMVFYEILMSYHIKAKIINTPRGATVSCGLSVRFDHSDFVSVKQVLLRRNFDAFAGFYEVFLIGNNQIVKRYI